MANTRLGRPKSTDRPHTARAAPPRASRDRRSIEAVPPGTSLRTFIIGEENRLACAAVQAVLCEGADRFFPMTVVGPAGAGKSHLLAGLAEAWGERHPGAVVAHHAAVDFALDFVAAIRTGRGRAWRERTEAVDVWLLDDVDRLSTKPAAQQELLHALDRLRDRGGMAVLTCRNHPGALRELAAPLRSRLLGGLVAPLQPAQTESRRTILQSLAASYSLSLEAEALDVLAREATSVSELHVLLEQLSHRPFGCGGGPVEPISVVQAELLLLSRSPAPRLELRSVAMRTARHFALKLADLRSASRRQSLVRARDVGMYLARQLTGESLERIGAYFGGRDHTTVMHGCRKIDSLLPSDPAIRQAVAVLRSSLTAG